MCLYVGTRRGSRQPEATAASHTSHIPSRTLQVKTGASVPGVGMARIVVSRVAFPSAVYYVFSLGVCFPSVDQSESESITSYYRSVKHSHTHHPAQTNNKPTTQRTGHPHREHHAPRAPQEVRKALRPHAASALELLVHGQRLPARLPRPADAVRHAHAALGACGGWDRLG